MSFSRREHLGYLEAALAEACAAPLSAKKVRLVALLADAFADRLFAAAGDGDLLVHRRELAARSAALAAISALAGGRARLVTEAVTVPLDDYPALPLADFMVSLYNAHTVQRVRIVLAEGSRLPAHETLTAAVAFLWNEIGVSQ